MPLFQVPGELVERLRTVSDTIMNTPVREMPPGLAGDFLSASQELLDIVLTVPPTEMTDEEMSARHAEGFLYAIQVQGGPNKGWHFYRTSDEAWAGLVNRTGPIWDTATTQPVLGWEYVESGTDLSRAYLAIPAEIDPMDDYDLSSGGK